MKTHLVTGGKGYVGSSIVKELLAQGQRVRVLDVDRDNLSLPSHPNLEIVHGHILDRDCVRASLTDVHFVHHCAAMVPLARNLKLFTEVNFHGTKLVSDESVRAGVQHFVQLSSSAVFQSTDTNNETGSNSFDESHPTSAFEPYGISKKLAEDYLFKQMQTHPQMKWTILRPRTVVGPGRMGILQLLFSWINKGRPVFLIGSGANPFQLIHSQDLARASVLSCQNSPGGVFHLGTDRFGTLRETLLELSQHAQTGSRLISLPRAPTQFALGTLDRLGVSPLSAWHYSSLHRNWSFNISKAQRELGWQPQFSNAEMLAKAYDWYLQYGIPKGPASLHQSGVDWKWLSFLKW